MIIKDWKKDVFTIPNILSVFRLLLIPVYISLYLGASKPTDYYMAAGILAISCLTDLVDGKIARHFNMISTLGKFLDPLADKVTQFTLIVCLTFKHPILLALVILFFIKEMYQFIAGLVAYRKGQMLKGAVLSGKVCTTVLFTTLTLLVLLPDISKTVVTVIAVVDLVFLLIAFLDYARIYCTHSPMLQELEKE